MEKGYVEAASRQGSLSNIRRAVERIAFEVEALQRTSERFPAEEARQSLLDLAQHIGGQELRDFAEKSVIEARECHEVASTTQEG